MTNQERVMKTLDRPSEAPWSPRELRQFWAIANQVYGKGCALERVHDAIRFQFHVDKMHSLTREEFIRLMNDLALKAAGQLKTQNSKLKTASTTLDACFTGSAMERPWRHIRYLQRQLGWTELHLVNYVKMAAHLDSINWLSVERSRGVITGMVKVLKNNRRLEG